MIHRIRTTIRPYDVLEVDDAELADLTWQGLVAENLGSAAPTLAARRGAPVRVHPNTES